MAAFGDSCAANDEVDGQIKTILCQPCLNKDKQTKAEKFCSTCDENQCMDCLTVHSTYAYMKGHNIVNANEAEMKQVSFDMKGLDRCNQHERILKFFCEDENKLCCSTCAVVDHRKCNSVIDVQRVVEKSAFKTSFLRIRLQEIKQKAEIIVKNVVYSEEKLDKAVKEIPVKIRQMRENVIKMFDELEASVIKDAESFQTDEMEKLTEKKSQNENYLADIQSCLETIDSVYKNGTSVQQFIVEQKMKKDVISLEKKIDENCQDLETVTVTFDFDESLKLPPLPIIEYVPGQLTVKSYLSEAASIISPPITTIRLMAVFSVDSKQSNDDERVPFYRGIDFLLDGRLVAVDNKNKKCLLYNEKLEKVGSYKLTYNPQSIVAVSEEDVAITSGKGYKMDILRVNKSNDITLVRTYNLTAPYDSICFKDGGQCVVGTVGHSTPVRFISSTGEEKDFNIKFPNKIYLYETSACTYIRNSDKVVLTDRYEHTVYIYDIMSNTRVVVKDEQIKEPCGTAVGPSDTILVCSKNTDSIVMISQTGQVLSSYKIDMKNPNRICVSSDKLFLAVTNKCISGGKLQILKVSF